MPTASEARDLAVECERLVATATTAENRVLLLKIARLWRDVASREEAVESGQAIALNERMAAEDGRDGVAVGSPQAEALLLRTRARQWRRKAVELRHMAEEAHGIGERSGYARLANNYDGLADQAELTAINLTETELV